MSVPKEEVTASLTGLMTKMARSGYSESQRKEVLDSGLEGYAVMRWRQRVMGRRVNRPRGEGAEGRAAKRLAGATSWFKPAQRLEELEPENRGKEWGDKEGRGGFTTQPSGTNGRHEPASRKSAPPEAAMFVPATHGSQLRKLLQKQDNKFSALHGEPGVRMVEEGGIKLSSILCKADPWAGGSSGRPHCLHVKVPKKERQGCAVEKTSSTD